MATIKTQVVNGITRILTKTTGGVRRVSCSCCAAEEEGCCMYPADEFETLFQMADLPDELLFNLYSDGNLVSTYTATKNDTANGIYWWDLGGGDSRALRHEGDQWVLYTAEFPNEQPPSTSLGGQRCLIDDPAFNASPVFEDNFSDTYTMTYVAEGETATATASRVSQCLWIADGDGLVLSGPTNRGGFIEYWTGPLFLGGELVSEGNVWLFGTNVGVIIKNGNQNTPVGSYNASSISE